jgi:hypothetical protein
MDYKSDYTLPFPAVKIKAHRQGDSHYVQKWPLKSLSKMCQKVFFIYNYLCKSWWYGRYN